MGFNPLLKLNIYFRLKDHEDENVENIEAEVIGNRTKTISETSEAASESSQADQESDNNHETDSDTDNLTMAELELLKKLEEANRFVKFEWLFVLLIMLLSD